MSKLLYQYLDVIDKCNFFILYLNGEAFYFNSSYVQHYIKPWQLSIDFIFKGSLYGQYNRDFNKENDLLTMPSYISVILSCKEYIFQCNVNSMKIRSCSSDSEIECHLDIPYICFEIKPISSIDETSFKLKEGSQIIGKNLYEILLNSDKKDINRAILFDWED